MRCQGEMVSKATGVKVMREVLAHVKHGGGAKGSERRMEGKTLRIGVVFRLDGLAASAAHLGEMEVMLGQRCC